MEQALTPVIAGQPAERQEEPKQEPFLGQEPFFWEPDRHAAIFGAANPSFSQLFSVSQPFYAWNNHLSYILEVKLIHLVQPWHNLVLVRHIPE